MVAVLAAGVLEEDLAVLAVGQAAVAGQAGDFKKEKTEVCLLNIF